jgi:hypothetical protein
MLLTSCAIRTQDNTLLWCIGACIRIETKVEHHPVEPDKPEEKPPEGGSN